MKNMLEPLDKSIFMFHMTNIVREELRYTHTHIEIVIVINSNIIINSSIISIHYTD